MELKGRTVGSCRRGGPHATRQGGRSGGLQPGWQDGHRVRKLERTSPPLPAAEQPETEV